jgi:hypothetical protein
MFPKSGWLGTWGRTATRRHAREDEGFPGESARRLGLLAPSGDEEEAVLRVLHGLGSENGEPVLPGDPPPRLGRQVRDDGLPSAGEIGGRLDPDLEALVGGLDVGLEVGEEARGREVSGDRE